MAGVEGQAQHVLAWLRSLDEHAEQRSVLTQMQVPEHRIASLYPVTFESIVPGLCAHLRATQIPELRLLRRLRGDMDYHASDLQQVLVLLPRELFLKSQADFKAIASDSMDQLREALIEQFGPVQVSPSHVAPALLQLWWLLSNRDHLPEIAWDSVDSAAAWFGEHLFKLPELTEGKR